MEKNDAEENYKKRILASVLSFLRDSGQSAYEIKALVDEALVSTSRGRAKASRSTAVLGSNVDTIYAVVLHRWHREKTLLDAEAKPLAIRLLGKHPSVESLIAAEKPDASARKIALSMKSVGLVKKLKSGKYYPTSRIATVSKIHPMLVEHVAKSISRYLDTVRQNTSPTRDVPTLIERYTHIPDLKKSEVREFRAFAQSHGSGFLASVDDWLEGRRARRTKINGKFPAGVSAGIHVFAYLEDPNPQPPTRRAKRA